MSRPRITVAERGRRSGGMWQAGVRRGVRAGRNALSGGGERIPVGERVRRAHLDHFCPGGIGLPVTDSGPIGLAPAAASPAGSENNIARAAGQRCGRCGQPVTSGQDARRRLCGTWVHEACPG
jgi:hypothetical protein